MAIGGVNVEPCQVLKDQFIQGLSIKFGGHGSGAVRASPAYPIIIHFLAAMVNPRGLKKAPSFRRGRSLR